MRTFTLLAAALLLFSGCATRSGVVWSVDSWDKTVRIADETYRVTDETWIFGPDGRRIALAELPSVAGSGIGVRTLARAEVDFQASERPDGLHLDALWMRAP